MHALLLPLWLLCAAACKDAPKEGASDGGALPVDSGGAGPSGGGDTGFVIGQDTFASGALDEEPANVLWLVHHGEWSMSPVGGPYTAVTGLLRVLEFIDGDVDQPWCMVVYSMVGESVPVEDYAGCLTCDYAFEVTFFVTIDGGERPLSDAEPLDTGGTYDPDDLLPVFGLEECRSPDLPADGTVWRMGWSELDELVYIDYGNTGTWIPWYAGDRDFDEIIFDWSRTYGFDVPEMEEEE
ncbi:MAG: hypothetical protein JNM72_15650 [Deltaproteobacteria bacterium]|nr:hypothetical protein [Deltaproteobacteria bacterium]